MCLEPEREEMVVSPWLVPPDVRALLRGSQSSLLQVSVVPDCPLLVMPCALQVGWLVGLWDVVTLKDC